MIATYHHIACATGTYSIPAFQTLAVSIVFEMFRSGLLPGLSKSKSARYPSLIDPRPTILCQILDATVAALSASTSLIPASAKYCNSRCRVTPIRSPLKNYQLHRWRPFQQESEHPHASAVVDWSLQLRMSGLFRRKRLIRRPNST